MKYNYFPISFPFFIRLFLWQLYDLVVLFFKSWCF